MTVPYPMVREMENGEWEWEVRRDGKVVASGRSLGRASAERLALEAAKPYRSKSPWIEVEGR